MTEPVTAEQHVLVDHLNWQGWIGTGPHGYTAGPADAPLLWQYRWSLVFLRTSSTGAHQLCLGFDWERTNAPRLPAMMLLVRRFIEMERDAQSAPFAANFDTSALLSLGLADAEQTSALTLTFEPSTGEAPAPRTLAPAEYQSLRAPGQPGFFSIERSDQRLVRGSAQFADPRQGDFRNSETFFNDESTQHRLAMERLTRPDPLASLWLALVVGLTLGSWWERSGGNRAP
jgi:hypothetical protein